MREEGRFQTKQEMARSDSLAVRRRCRARRSAGRRLLWQRSWLREELEKLELAYAVGIQSSTTVWHPGTAPLPPRARKTTGSPAHLLRRDQHHQLLSVKQLALSVSVPQICGGAVGTKASGAPCTRVLPACASALPIATTARRTVSGTAAADRMAQGEERADEVLAVEPTRIHPFVPSGSAGQTAMDHRARLSG